ncbi:hypothetical protein [Vulcanisaeta distributa]|uniref:hypothetical protein n=1 Tax=Vulcanisaeta distributa TaxID=164451 RepID=UPI0006CF3310|nr:hypothetical protein [Vulcanisaeta distributa]
MVMGLRVGGWLVAVLVIVAVVVSLLVVRSTWHIGGSSSVSPSHVGQSIKLPSLIIPNRINYGAVLCNSSYDLIMPGGSAIALVYHVHGGDMKINGYELYIDFPTAIINETLSSWASMSYSGNAMWLGIYLNGRLIASNNQSQPLQALAITVNHPYVYGNKTMNFWQIVNTENWYVIHTGIGVGFPAINVTPGDTIVVILYSAVPPYALPICNITSEAEEVQLMVKYGWIGNIGASNIPTAKQLFENGQYIIEEPTIYVITKSITNPQSISMDDITPGISNIAPEYMLSYSWYPLPTNYAVIYSNKNEINANG